MRSEPDCHPDQSDDDDTRHQRKADERRAASSEHAQPAGPAVALGHRTRQGDHAHCSDRAVWALPLMTPSMWA